MTGSHTTIKQQTGLLLFAVGLLTGCVSGKPLHISASEFERRCSYIGSVDDYQYLGRLADRAYLRYSYIPLFALIFDIHPKELPERIFYVNLSELDKPFRDSLPRTPERLADVHSSEPFVISNSELNKLFGTSVTPKNHETHASPFPGPPPIRGGRMAPQ